MDQDAHGRVGFEFFLRLVDRKRPEFINGFLATFLRRINCLGRGVHVELVSLGRFD